MKKPSILLTISAIVLVLGLTSCYWVFDSGLGSLQLDLSALSAKGPGVPSARIYLIANNLLHPLGDGVDYVQVGYNQVTEITLEDIPVGPTYRVAVSMGYTEPGWFDTHYWAESADFEIFPGAKTAVVFDTDDFDFSEDPFNPVQYDPENMMDKKLIDVEVYGSSVYAADSAKLYELPNYAPYSPLGIIETNAPGGQSINSVSIAADDWASFALCANTNRDIYSYFGYPSSFFNSIATTDTLEPVSILDSSAGTFSSDRLIFFRGADSWGGTFAPGETSAFDWKWAIQSSDRVTDMVVSNDADANAYFATAGGAFRVKGDYLYEVSTGGSPNLNAYKTGFNAPSPIISLELVEVGFTALVVNLVMGTENGVWEATLASDPDVINQPTQRDGTQGFRIRQIAASNYTNPYFIAYLSDAYLFVWNDLDKELYRFPIAAGLPGRITGMAWFDTGSAYCLLVSGENGLAFKEFNYPV